MYEKEGRFGEDVEEDPPTRELQPSEIDYLRKKLKSRIKTRLTYKVARTFLNKIIENKQLIIKDVIGTEHMDALTSGAVIPVIISTHLTALPCRLPMKNQNSAKNADFTV